MIQNLIFDLGGVLLNIDLPHCMNSVKALGVDFDRLSAHPAFASVPTSQKPAVMGEGVVATGAVHLYQVGEISTEQFIGGIQQLCRQGTTYQQVLDAWNTCCINIPQYRLDKILQLRQQGYHIYMLSNTNDAHWQYIMQECFGGQEQVGKYFDKTFLSQEMHLAKPNDDIYLAMLQEIGAEPADCLFIDDSTPNLQAAAALGFHTLHADVSKTQNGKVIAPPAVEWKDQIDRLLQ